MSSEVDTGVLRSQDDVQGADRILAGLGDPVHGPRLLDLWAWPDPADPGLEILVGEGEDLRWVTAPVPPSLEYPAVGHRSPAATWLEADLTARRLAHPVTRAPSPDRGLGDAPVEPLRDAGGPGLFTIPFGPIRSGVVEAVRYDVATAGEDMVRVAVRPGSKRRDLERRLTELPIDLAPEVAERVAGMYSTSVAAAVCRAIESAARVPVTMEAEAVRVALVELERVFNHLDAILKLCDDASLAVGVAQVGMLKERVLRLLATLTGHRFGRGVVALGGVRRGLHWAGLARELARLEDDVDRVRRRLLRTNSLLDRLQRTGNLAPAAAAALGASGPVARGSGLAWDARRERPWATYARLGFVAAVMTDTDVMARFEVRLAEVRESFRLLKRLAVEGEPAGAPLRVQPAPGDIGLASAESPEGEWIVSVEMGSEGRLRRCRLRPPSILNFACFEIVCRGRVLTDFAFIEHSFGLSIAGRDR